MNHCPAGSCLLTLVVLQEKKRPSTMEHLVDCFLLYQSNPGFLVHTKHHWCNFSRKIRIYQFIGTVLKLAGRVVIFLAKLQLSHTSNTIQTDWYKTWQASLWGSLDWKTPQAPHFYPQNFDDGPYDPCERGDFTIFIGRLKILRFCRWCFWLLKSHQHTIWHM